MGDYLEQVKEFAERNALEFWDWTLLRSALTHRSYLNEHPELDWEDNERLEYLGDAVLDFLLAEYLFHQFPNASEGELTALRAALVRRETLAQFAQRMGLGPSMFMGHGEVETGGRERLATLCAAFEALVGAVYLDQGMEGVTALVLPLIERGLGAARAEVADKDPKSRLQELAQGTLAVTPRYRTLKAEGPDHAKTFTVEVVIGDAVWGIGIGPSKQLAAQRAAAEALAQARVWAGPGGDGRLA
jgi:ribonuclease-3